MFDGWEELGKDGGGIVSQHIWNQSRYLGQQLLNDKDEAETVRARTHIDPCY